MSTGLQIGIKLFFLLLEWCTFLTPFFGHKLDHMFMKGKSLYICRHVTMLETDFLSEPKVSLAKDTQMFTFLYFVRTFY